MKIDPQKLKEEKASNPLEVSSQKKTALIKKAKELLTKPMEPKELMNALEQYYVTEHNEHYTSAQLAEVIKEVQVEFTPPVEVVEELEPQVLTK